jgi:hypothetical protein
MGKPTFNQTTSLKLNEFVSIQSMATSDAHVDFTATFHLPAGMQGVIYRYVDLLPGYTVVDTVVDGAVRTWTDEDAFARHVLSGQLSDYTGYGLYADLLMAVKYVGTNTFLKFVNVMPDVDVQAYTNSKFAPAMWKIWDYFDTSNQWGDLETETYTHEVDLKNGYIAVGHIVTFADGIPTGITGPITTANFPRIVEAEARFIEVGETVGSMAKYPFDKNRLGTGERPIGTADIQIMDYVGSSTPSQVVVWITNTSGAAVTAANSPTMRLLI